jgi:DNA-binding XRE family transcriptional regulator
MEINVRQTMTQEEAEEYNRYLTIARELIERGYPTPTNDV